MKRHKLKTKKCEKCAQELVDICIKQNFKYNINNDESFYDILANFLVKYYNYTYDSAMHEIDMSRYANL